MKNIPQKLYCSCNEAAYSFKKGTKTDQINKKHKPQMLHSSEKVESQGH